MKTKLKMNESSLTLIQETFCDFCKDHELDFETYWDNPGVLKNLGPELLKELHNRFKDAILNQK